MKYNNMTCVPDKHLVTVQLKVSHMNVGLGFVSVACGAVALVLANTGWEALAIFPCSALFPLSWGPVSLGCAFSSSELASIATMSSRCLLCVGRVGPYKLSHN